jgi:hypothetical protein
VGFGIRVTFLPTLRLRESGSVDVPGARVGLEVFGQNPPAKRFTKRPATLVWFGAYLENVRGVSSPTFSKIATVRGDIELKGDPPKAAITFPPDAEVIYVEPEPAKGESFRELRLELVAPSFRGTPPKLARLRLPKAPAKARFFELGVELKISGATEAGVDKNERLDVPLRFPVGQELTWVGEAPASSAATPELVLFDEDGNEDQRLPIQGGGPGALQTIDLTGVRGGARLLELHSADKAVLPLLRVDLDELRERLSAGIAGGIAEVLKPSKSADAEDILNDSGAEDVPDPDQASPPLLPAGGAI